MNSKFDVPYFSIDLREIPLGLTNASFGKADETLRQKLSGGKVGFYDWSSNISAAEIETTKKIARELRDNFEGAIVFGIGGSYLGPLAVTEALAADSEFPIYWLSNVDPEEVRRMEKIATKKKLAAIVTSKSGGTVETLSSFFHLSRHLDPQGYVAITDPEKGELRRLADKNGWKSLPVPPNIGGRFSVLSAVGLLPAELAGVDAKRLLAGANEMRKHLESMGTDKNPAYWLAANYQYWDNKGFPVQYFMPYQKNLTQTAGWFVQLWAESIGKHPVGRPNESVGFTPVPALGTTDQHSLLQLFKEGPRNKLIGFIDVRGSDHATTAVQQPKFEVAESHRYLFKQTFENITHHASLATEKSLRNSGVPTYRIEIPKLSPEMFGAFFLFFETACAFAGELYGVDAFDQPGVEEAKKLLREAL